MNAAHNDWLQWGADGGLPMLACIFALFVGSLWVLRRAPWAAGVPIAFVHCLIDFPMQGHFMPAVVFLMFGIAARSATRRSEPAKATRPVETLDVKMLAEAEV